MKQYILLLLTLYSTGIQLYAAVGPEFESPEFEPSDSDEDTEWVVLHTIHPEEEALTAASQEEVLPAAPRRIITNEELRARALEAQRIANQLQEIIHQPFQVRQLSVGPMHPGAKIHRVMQPSTSSAEVQPQPAPLSSEEQLGYAELISRNRELQAQRHAKESAQRDEQLRFAEVISRNRELQAQRHAKELAQLRTNAQRQGWSQARLNDAITNLQAQQQEELKQAEFDYIRGR